MLQPMYEAGPSGFPWLGVGLLAVGIIGLVLGFAMILWITRNPEDSSDHWRSHHR
jgi:hypothetical protein